MAITALVMFAMKPALESPPSNSPSPSPSPSPLSVNHSTPTTTNPQTLDVKPFIDYAVGQVLYYQKTFNDAIDSAIDASTSRFSQIRSTSSAHFHQSLDYLDDFKSQYDAYEELLFGKIKEGVLVAASHPVITSGATASMGLLVLKRPRRFLYYNMQRLFVSEESLVSKASEEVKELRQSIDLLKSEVERMEKSALHAEEQFLHGRTKLRQAGKQIRNVIQSAYKIERRAGGLKDILGELPKSEASHFRSQGSSKVLLRGSLGSDGLYQFHPHPSSQSAVSNSTANLAYSTNKSCAPVGNSSSLQFGTYQCNNVAYPATVPSNNSSSSLYSIWHSRLGHPEWKDIKNT